MGSVLGTKPGADPLFCAARISSPELSSPELLAERNSPQYLRAYG